MKTIVAFLLVSLLMIVACKPKENTETTQTETTPATETKQTTPPPTPSTEQGLIRGIKPAEMLELIANAKFDKDIDATFETNKGNINVTLYATKTPKTVANFLGLVDKGFYNGLTFHRVIPDFMIQGGCPLGNGRGNPGYKFEDEFVADLKHNAPGVLSMANSGPNTNGSQFFITHKETPWLDGKHTVWGKVKSAEDQKVVNSIVMGDQILKVTYKK